MNTNATNLTRLPKNVEHIFIRGLCGDLECLRFMPNATPIGCAIMFHPDPQGGGNFSNKVVYTAAKTLSQYGYICYCPNLRGVGLSAGVHDFGKGEILDAQAIHSHITQMHQNLQLILAGFSFGSMIASALANSIDAVQALVLIGPAVTRYTISPPESVKTFVIHGELDEVIPMHEVLLWAKNISQPIIWVPDTGHFFHGKLPLLANILTTHILS